MPNFSGCQLVFQVFFSFCVSWPAGQFFVILETKLCVHLLFPQKCTCFMDVTCIAVVLLRRFIILLAMFWEMLFMWKWLESSCFLHLWLFFRIDFLNPVKRQAFCINLPSSFMYFSHHHHLKFYHKFSFVIKVIQNVSHLL